MPSVYDPENFAGRVDLACRVISTKGESTRAFDTCFEMYDGDEVAVAVYRRSMKIPAVAANIWRYLAQSSVMPEVERLAGVKNLAAEARKTRARRRAEAEARFAEWERAAEAAGAEG